VLAGVPLSNDLTSRSGRAEVFDGYAALLFHAASPAITSTATATTPIIPTGFLRTLRAASFQSKCEISIKIRGVSGSIHDHIYELSRIQRELQALLAIAATGSQARGGYGIAIPHHVEGTVERAVDFEIIEVCLGGREGKDPV